MRWRGLAALVVVAAGMGVWLWLRAAPDADAPPSTDAVSPVTAAPPPATESPPAADETPLAEPPSAAPDADLFALPGDEAAFASIDLEAARAALPDNLYWETAAPTQDPRLLGDRERAKETWNVQYGKILSGTGTEAEIRAFYDRRMQLSSDYVRFVDWVLEHQGGDLSEQDQKLLHLARRLHLARSSLATRENLRGTVRALEGETLYARAGERVGWVAIAMGLLRRSA